MSGVVPCISSQLLVTFQGHVRRYNKGPQYSTGIPCFNVVVIVWEQGNTSHLRVTTEYERALDFGSYYVWQQIWKSGCCLYSLLRLSTGNIIPVLFDGIPSWTQKATTRELGGTPPPAQRAAEKEDCSPVRKSEDDFLFFDQCPDTAYPAANGEVLLSTW